MRAYMMFFLGLNFVSGLLRTLKSKKNFKNLKKKPKTFFQPWNERTHSLSD